MLGHLKLYIKPNVDLEIDLISMILRGCEDIYRQQERALSAGASPGDLRSLTTVPRDSSAAEVASQTPSDDFGDVNTFLVI